ncbi:MAG: NAD(P)-dependent oxidoreductase [Sphingobium sp.]
MSLVIASQMEEAFNEGLRAHGSRPTVIPAPETAPWQVAGEADVILVRPSPIWRSRRDAQRPQEWPGRIRWVYSASAGVDAYPRWLLDAPLVSCGRGVSSEEIADYVLAAIYLQEKNLDALRVTGPDQWRSVPLGRVAGSTVGIVGLGAIGAAVARRALAAGARVTAIRRRTLPSPVPGVDLLDDIHAVAASADHLVLALPGTEATRHLVGRSVLAHARPTAHLINVGRGSVLDQEALIEALDEGRLGQATLDVTEPEPLPPGHPLWTHPRVRLTPHVSSNHQRVRDLLFERVSRNLTRFLSGEGPGDLVDPVAGY